MSKIKPGSEITCVNGDTDRYMSEDDIEIGENYLVAEVLDDCVLKIEGGDHYHNINWFKPYESIATTDGKPFAFEFF